AGAVQPSGSDIASNEIGTSGGPSAAALTVLRPGAEPRVHDPALATPSLPVTGSASPSVPPPATTLKCTGTPATGWPRCVVTSTDGTWATAVPAAEPCVRTLAASAAAGCGGSTGSLHAIIAFSPVRSASAERLVITRAGE